MHRIVSKIMKIRFTLFVLAIVIMADASAQNIRCSYSVWKKDDPEGKYRVYRDMKVDCFNQRTVYYSEASYLRDSLRSIAFDESGMTKDADAYAKLTRIRLGNSDMTSIDFSTQETMQGYSLASCLIVGNMPLIIPAWTIGEESKEILGYVCQKAETRYLGRTWSIWFTEDVPANIGPWLLWGAPGLIVEARDSDNLIVFKLSGVEWLNDGSRIDAIRKFYTERRFENQQLFNYPMKRAEALYTKAMTDTGFFYQLIGATQVFSIDSNGNKVPYQRPPYLPTIPSNYWQTQ